MIRITLSEVLGKKKMTRKKVSELTGVRANTIGDLYNEKVKKIDLDTLNKICSVLDCSISDLLVFEKDTYVGEDQL